MWYSDPIGVLKIGMGWVKIYGIRGYKLYEKTSMANIIRKASCHEC
jgi:hypothetical protein